MVHVDEQLYHTLINMVSVRVIFRSVVRGFDVSNVIFEARVNNDALRLFWLAYRRATENVGNGCWGNEACREAMMRFSLQGMRICYV